MSNKTCVTTILDGQLAMPNIGLCDPSGTILFWTCLATFIIQFARHALWSLTSVTKYEILAEARSKRCDILKPETWGKVMSLAFIQLGKTLLWVVSLLIIVNANYAVIVTHTVADVFSCIFWIVMVRKMKTKKITEQAIERAIETDEEHWAKFCIGIIDRFEQIKKEIDVKKEVLIKSTAHKEEPQLRLRKNQDLTF